MTLDPAAAGRWSLGWAMLCGLVLGLTLTVFGSVPSGWSLGLLSGVAAGLVAAAWTPTRKTRPGWLGLWALCMAVGATLCGGLAGPLGLWCLIPLLAGLVLGAPVRESAAAAAVTFILTAAGSVLGRVAPPMGPAGLLIGAGAVLSLLISAAAAAHILRRRGTEARKAMLQQTERMGALLGNLPGLALSLDRKGRVLYAYGQPLAHLTHAQLFSDLCELVAEADRGRVRAALSDALDHLASDVVFHLIAAPDEPVEAQLRSTPDDLVVAVLRDLSHAAATDPALTQRLAALEAERDSAQGQRKEAEQLLQARSRFLANMSHELRTPLNAIMGFSEIMQTRMFGELTPKYGEYADLIHESGRHLMDLINDVLDMSKIEAERFQLHMEDFDARDAVTAALRLMRVQAEEAGVRLRTVLPNDPLMVRADKRALKQMVLNLVSNALKFTPHEGEVTISLDRNSTAMTLTVADTGVGISPEDLQRLGRPFEQAGDATDKVRGTGLGLSLVKAFAQLHGGDLALESVVGEGTAATVRMPVLLP